MPCPVLSIYIRVGVWTIALQFASNFRTRQESRHRKVLLHRYKSTEPGQIMTEKRYDSTEKHAGCSVQPYNY